MTQATVIKICGLTTAEDARLALDAGADWIGLNFVAGPRKITLDVASRILESVQDPARAVALLLIDEEEGRDTDVQALENWGVRRFQLYGAVTPDTMAGFLDRGAEVITVQSIADHESLQAAERFLSTCGDRPPTYYLIDAVSDSRLGGTGRVANWPALSHARRTGLMADWPPLILAGGLHADNVGAAIKTVAPWGVDVCSGVESQPGRKDPQKVTAFVEAVRRVM